MKTLTLNHSKRRIFDAIKKAGSKLDLDIESSDVSKGKLLLYSSGGLLSFGNKIVVKISTKNGKSVVKVSSKSAASIQIIDWGTNKDLEQDLVEEVKGILTR